MYTVLGLIFLFAVFIIVVNVLQNNKPSWLPKILQTWLFLPLFLRSLEPYNRVVTKMLCCAKFKVTNKISPVENNLNDTAF